jgi:hypothetical protein
MTELLNKKIPKFCCQLNTFILWCLDLVEGYFRFIFYVTKCELRKSKIWISVGNWQSNMSKAFYSFVQLNLFTPLAQHQFRFAATVLQYLVIQ